MKRLSLFWCFTADKLKRKITKIINGGEIAVVSNEWNCEFIKAFYHKTFSSLWLIFKILDYKKDKC